MVIFVIKFQPMEIIFSKPWLKAFSTLSINLSAGSFALAFITPNFANINNAGAILFLIRNIIFGIVFFAITVFIESINKNE